MPNLRWYGIMRPTFSAKDCVDQFCEVVGSEWLDRLKERLPAGRVDFHHYAVYFTKCGFLEVLCHKIAIGPEIAGTLVA
jgi:hypothetical protein